MNANANTSSSKIFSERRFSILSPGEQFRRYGLRAFALWFKIFHYIDIGHFVWAHPAAERQDRPLLQWWGTVLANALICLLALWRGSGFRSFAPIAPAGQAEGHEICPHSACHCPARGRARPGNDADGVNRANPNTR